MKQTDVSFGVGAEDSMLPERDAELDAVYREEYELEQSTLQLIASENFVSDAVRRATGSILTNRFADGLASSRTYGTDRAPVDVDALARRRACTLFSAEHANVAPHSGTSANLAVCAALVEPGDTIMGLRTDRGGHLSHGAPLNLSGIVYRSVGYGISGPDERIDFGQIRDLALRERPRIVFCGATAYPRIIDPEPFREICDEIGAWLVFDAAHVAGLIAGGAHPNPVGCADVVTITTHKTLRGPRGGAILCSKELAQSVDDAVCPGVQGGPLLHVIAAKAAAFHEAQDPTFRTYIEAVVTNARALGSALESEGFRLVTGGTDTHMVLADLRTFDPDLSGRQAESALDRVGISVTRCPAGGDERLPVDTSGIRLGTAALTTLGAQAPDMEAVARLVASSLRNGGDDSQLRAIRQSVTELSDHFAAGRRTSPRSETRDEGSLGQAVPSP